MLITLVLVSCPHFARAQAFGAGGDQSRFTETPYKTALPGMQTPAAYIEMARKAIKEHSHGIIFREFSEPIVTQRIYRNAPPSDRDIIAVQFVYQGTISGGRIGGFVYNRKVPGVPALQALIRRDGSKIYLHVIQYKQ